MLLVMNDIWLFGYEKQEMISSKTIWSIYSLLKCHYGLDKVLNEKDITSCLKSLKSINVSVSSCSFVFYLIVQSFHSASIDRSHWRCLCEWQWNSNNLSLLFTRFIERLSLSSNDDDMMIEDQFDWSLDKTQQWCLLETLWSEIFVEKIKC